MRAWARMADIRLQQDRRHRPRLPLLRRPQGAERLQRPEDDASQDREGVEQGAQRRPEADRRDRQLQQARLVEVQGGPRVVRPRSEPSAQGKADPGCPYCSGRKVLAGYNDLAATHPGIAAMWHPRMNKRLKPTGVQAVSRKPAWWRGECGHVYQMAVRDRVGAKPGYRPYCSGRKRPERPIRLDQPSAPRRGRNGEASVPPAYRRDFANIGLGGYAWRLWGSASFSMLDLCIRRR